MHWATFANLVLGSAALAAAPSDPSALRTGARSLAPAGFHAIAYVNDFDSHGTIGDALLSLEEAILLHNGTVDINLFSPTELAQVSLIPGTGNTTDVTWIDIDGSATPTITIERDLSPILDTSFGLLIKGFNEPPVLDFSGPGITRGLEVPANSMALEDLVLSGGPYGIDIVQTDVSGQSGATFENVRFEGQSQFAIRVRATSDAGIGRVIVSNCEFENVPVAIRSEETGASRTSIFELRDVRARGVDRGVEVLLGAGGFGRYTLDALDIQAATAGVQIVRPTGADRLIAVEGTGSLVRAPLGLEIDGSANALTQLSLRLWELDAGPAGTALDVGAAAAVVDGAIDELSFEGSVSLRAGGGASTLALGNWRGKRGTVNLVGSQTQAIEASYCRFDDCVVDSQGAGALSFFDSCFVGGSVRGSASAPVAIVDSFRSALVTSVTETRALLVPQLGSMVVTPDDVEVGGSVTLQLDLPPGLSGVFVLGPTQAMPLLLPQPLHLYTVPSETVQLPGVFRAQQSLVLQVPFQLSLVGADVTAQAAVFPDPGMVAPPIQLPPGRRFVLRAPPGGGGGG